MKKGAVPEAKICAVCGRKIEWRKKWEKNWDGIKYCGDACRARRGEDRANFEEQILSLLAERARGKTICPSEILPLEKKTDPVAMEKVRQAARRLVAAGRIEMTQKGQVVDPSTARGPIRLRLRE